jgi:hypothetical protein
MSSSDPQLYTRFTALKNTNPGLQTWISIGGWSMNDPDQPTAATFSTLAGSTDAQSKFFASVLSFLETYGFDGVDLDWSVGFLTLFVTHVPFSLFLNYKGISCCPRTVGQCSRFYKLRHLPSEFPKYLTLKRPQLWPHNYSIYTRSFNLLALADLFTSDPFLILVYATLRRRLN